MQSDHGCIENLSIMWNKLLKQVESTVNDVTKQAQQIVDENPLLKDACRKVTEVTDNVSGSINELTDSVKSKYTETADMALNILSVKLCDALKDVDFEAVIEGIKREGKQRNLQVKPLVEVVRKLQTWYEEGKR